MKSLIALISLFLAGLALPAQNQNISNGIVFDGEPFLAVNPQNSQHLVSAWMGFVPFKIAIKTSVSTDGGASWSNPVSIPHQNSAFGSADPCLDFDSQGNVIMSYIDFSLAIDSGAVYCVRSTDGGFSWGNPVVAIDLHDDPDKSPIDRPWMVVDRSGGATDGHVYITAMSAGGVDPSVIPPYHPYFVRSMDGGQNFLPLRRLDTTNFESGSIINTPMPSPAIASNGKLYMAYPAYVPSQNLFARKVIVTSNDGGTTLQHAENNILSPGLSDDDAKKAALLRVNPSDPNHLIELAIFAIHGDGDVFFSESFDAGATWTAPLRVNDDPIGNDRMQDMVWADFDTDGDLVVAWRDRRNGSDSTFATDSEIWGAVRLKHKNTFEPNFNFTDQLIPYDTILAEAGNDFLCVRLQNDTLSAVWGDVRTGRLNIWFQRRDLAGVVLSNQLLSSESRPEILMYPNPATEKLRLEGNEIQKVEIFDVEGRLLNRQHWGGINKVDLNLDGYPAGMLWLRIQSADGEHYRKVIRQ